MLFAPPALCIFIDFVAFGKVSLAILAAWRKKVFSKHFDTNP
jgi:hypothetical protein